MKIIRNARDLRLNDVRHSKCLCVRCAIDDAPTLSHPTISSEDFNTRAHFTWIWLKRKKTAQKKYET